MAANLNHTVVYVEDKQVSAAFVSEVLGLPKPLSFYSFLVVGTGNGVSLDFLDSRDPIAPQHYAFLVSEAEFDQIFARIKAGGIRFYADHLGRAEGQINHNDGGRGLYFAEPSGHWLEIITRPYGG